MAIQIELLSGRHNRSGFDCGEPSLNEWLARMALQQQKKNYVRTRVAVDPLRPQQVLGYYSLLAHEVDTSHFPGERKLPRRLPAVLLARLAVDKAAQGRGIGKLLLFDSVHRARASAAEVASIGLVVDALNDGAADFYRAYGFEAFRDDPHRLILVLR